MIAELIKDVKIAIQFAIDHKREIELLKETCEDLKRLYGELAKKDSKDIATVIDSEVSNGKRK